MSDSTRILFYDIASGPPVTGYAPNPWKTRYALNIKQASYKTEWVELPDVTSVRKRIGAAPNRTFPDGTPFYTLPIIEDISTEQVVGDSFDIALYLDKIYPDEPQLFPPGSVGLHAAFNVQIDAAMTPWWLLYSHGIPMNPETAEATRAKFLERGPLKHWDDLAARGEERTKQLENMKETLGGLVKFYRRRDEGPFLEGVKPIYADCIVGGWLAFFNIALDGWDEVKTWHDGLWGKLHQAMEEYAQVK